MKRKTGNYQIHKILPGLVITAAAVDISQNGFHKDARTAFNALSITISVIILSL